MTYCNRDALICVILSDALFRNLCCLILVEQLTPSKKQDAQSPRLTTRQLAANRSFYIVKCVILNSIARSLFELEHLTNVHPKHSRRLSARLNTRHLIGLVIGACLTGGGAVWLQRSTLSIMDTQRKEIASLSSEELYRRNQVASLETENDHLKLKMGSMTPASEMQ